MVDRKSLSQKDSTPAGGVHGRGYSVCARNFKAVRYGYSIREARAASQALGGAGPDVLKQWSAQHFSHVTISELLTRLFTGRILQPIQKVFENKDLERRFP